AQQELPEAMPGAHQIATDILPAADQITQLLMLDRRDRHQRQLPGSEPPREPDPFSLMGLAPLGQSTISAPWRAHPQLDALRPRATREPIPGRPRLVHHPG